MVQAFRRVSGRIRRSGLETSASPPPTPPPRSVAADRIDIFQKADRSKRGSSLSDLGDRRGNGIEERSPKFDEMLNHVVGRITSKAGGKSEIGEHNRPSPKVRNLAPDSETLDVDRSAPPGTLNAIQLRNVMLLHQGKIDGQNQPMDTKEIAERFRLDASQLEKVLRYVSLPQVDLTRTKQKDDQ